MSDENDFNQWLYNCPKYLSNHWPMLEFLFAAEGFFYLCMFNGKSPKYQYFYEILWNFKQHCNKLQDVRFIWTMLFLYEIEDVNDIFDFPVIVENLV